jgi:hypothetical protein
LQATSKKLQATEKNCRRLNKKSRQIQKISFVRARGYLRALLRAPALSVSFQNISSSSNLFRRNSWFSWPNVRSPIFYCCKMTTWLQIHDRGITAKSVLIVFCSMKT